MSIDSNISHKLDSLVLLDYQMISQRSLHRAFNDNARSIVTDYLTFLILRKVPGGRVLCDVSCINNRDGIDVA